MSGAASQQMPRLTPSHHPPTGHTVLVVTSDAADGRSERALLDALERRGVARWDLAAQGWPPASAFVPHTAVVFFVRFRHLVAGEPIDWGGYQGVRVLYDHDACQNYAEVISDTYLGAWPREVRRHRFDLLVVTGGAVARRLAGEGVTTAWVPKGYDVERFTDLGLARAGVCTYGSPYRARAAMARRLDRAGVPVDRLAVPYNELGVRLNRYAACVVCAMEGRPRFGRVGRAVERLRPGTLLAVAPGPEPLIKHFEAAGAGCAVMTDAVPDLKELGFVDGETVLVYRDFDDLVDRLRSTGDDELCTIGRRAGALCRARHTWAHRADELLATVHAHHG